MATSRPIKTTASGRAERSAEALRANLKRRKQQLRGRLQAEKALQKGAAPRDSGQE